MDAAVTTDARGILVVGIGAQTALGKTAPACAAAVRAKICRFSEHPYMWGADGEPVHVARVPWLSADTPLAERVTALGQSAAREAARPLSGLPSAKRPSRLAVVVATSNDRLDLPPRWEDVLASRVRADLETVFPELDVETRVSGHAAGILALQRGCELLRSGERGFCLVGGVDSHLGPRHLAELERRRQLHGFENPWGFIPGEGAGFCLLASEEAAKTLELEPLLELRAAASSREPNTRHSRTVCVGAGLSQAAAAALEFAPDPVTQIVCDQNGEPYRADEFAFTLARHARRVSAPADFWTPADCWGDVGAASVPLFASLVIASGRRGYASGLHALLLTSSETEERGAALVRLPTIAEGQL